MIATPKLPAERCGRFPNTEDPLALLLAISAFQLFDHHMASACDTDIDQLGNLAKGVTVELRRKQ